jgi:hypothetical protein
LKRQKVALLRRRLQIEQRLDELSRRREGGIHRDEMRSSTDCRCGTPSRLHVFPVRRYAPIDWLDRRMEQLIESSTPFWLFGLLFAGGSAITKLFLERRTDEDLSDNTRHREQVRTQLADIKKERDEIDAELPPGGGPLDARLREAESELREIERLMPVLGDRTAAEEKVKAAERKVESAQEAFKTARSRWREALKAVGLPEDFAPQKVRYVVRRGESSRCAAAARFAVTSWSSASAKCWRWPPASASSWPIAA